MDNQNGGRQLSSAQRQQNTAAALARQKVLEAYKHQMSNYHSPADKKPEAEKPVVRTAAQPQAYAQATTAKAATQTAITKTTTPQIKTEDWRKYHSAWQDYYQKYYGEYYGKAARDYITREREKYQREAALREANIKAAAERKIITSNAGAAEAAKEQDSKSMQADFKAKIQEKVSKRAKKVRKSRHFVPLVVGFTILVLGLMFQYNQVIVANVVAFMSPGGSEVNDITAIDPTVSANVHDKPYLMIPKLNVEVPITFGSKNDVKSMNVAMSKGVAHFNVSGASAKPGEIGNFVVSGHSAGNIYQQSDYKFIFSGLTRMKTGDLIYADYNKQRYTYRVTGSKVVDPSDVNALRKIASDNSGKPMITLITCTPLGTSKYRLLVYGEQIHPSYEGAEEPDPTPVKEEDDNTTMPKNDDSPLEQFWKWLTGQE
ncbi:sortase [Candidatus Saccharibacteria bacterium]|nr:sortase [Candidatus Saccharibacteria bacterium]